MLNKNYMVLLHVTNKHLRAKASAKNLFVGRVGPRLTTGRSVGGASTATVVVSATVVVGVCAIMNG